MKLLSILFLIAVGAQAQTVSTAKADSLFTNLQWKTAIPIYEEAIRLGVDNAVTWNRLGYCYHNVGRIDDAIKHYLISISKNPSVQLEQIVQVRLARAYSLKKEMDNSFKAIDRSVILGYANANELETNADFLNLKSDKRFTPTKKAVYENAFPCQKNNHAREFDFWVGEWDVYNTGSTQPAVGKSKIENASGGCMILENFYGVGDPPYAGKSINFVDPATNKWIQMWVGSSGINNLNMTRFYDGEYHDGAMRFVFDRELNGTKTIGRFIFYNEGPNQVRQFNEQSVDGGKTWTTSYDLTYKRTSK